MKIILELETPICGYWDDGAKSKFTFTSEAQINPLKDFIPYAILRWGSWEANFWFTCLAGKTKKQAISIAKRKLLKGLYKGNSAIKSLEGLE